MNAQPYGCQAPVSDPFRLLFPTGMMLGIVGVALWPLFQVGYLPFYPAIAHARLLIEGFAACFIFGFLMTAGPRLLEAPSFTWKSVIACLAFILASSAAHLFQKPAIGDALFCLSSLFILFGAVRAYANRKDTPPPGFPLAALGLLSAAIGSVLLSLHASVWAHPYTFSAGKILLYQGFTLLPIVGVGGFFFPKILGGRNLHDFPVMQTPNAAWKKRFRNSLLVGVLFIVSIVFEIYGQITIAYAIRVISLSSYILIEIPFREFSRKDSLHGVQLIFALVSIAVGLLGVLFFPALRIAWLHAYFTVGLTGVILLVSLRVVFGHSERPDLIRKSVKIFACLFGLLALAGSSRIYADFAPAHQQSHYLYAALCWLACGIVWMVFVGPKNLPPRGQ